MRDFLFLVPLSLLMGMAALGAFLWSLRHEQYEDLDGAAERMLFADDRPLMALQTDSDTTASHGAPDADQVGEARDDISRDASSTTPRDHSADITRRRKRHERGKADKKTPPSGGVET